MSDNILEVQHLCKNFEGFVAVDDLSFAVKTNEIFGFLGPNGAGKTTTALFLISKRNIQHRWIY